MLVTRHERFNHETTRNALVMPRYWSTSDMFAMMITQIIYKEVVEKIKKN